MNYLLIYNFHIKLFLFVSTTFLLTTLDYSEISFILSPNKYSSKYLISYNFISSY